MKNLKRTKIIQIPKKKNREARSPCWEKMTYQTD